MAPQKIVRTPRENAIKRYQAQGSYPEGELVIRSYSLFDTLKFASATREYTLFGTSSGQSGKFSTNMLGASSIPGGQSFAATGMSFSLDFGSTADADFADNLNSFYKFMRNSLFKFARANEDWAAYFHGAKTLPSVTFASETAGNRVGDFVRPTIGYSFAIPVVIGQNTSFSVDVVSAADPAAALVSAGCSIKVFLDGAITKKNAT